MSSRRILVFAALIAGCAIEHRADHPAAVLFLTDYGTKDGAVAVCKAVMWNIAPRLRIVDLTHEVPQYDVQTAAEVLEQAVPYYPTEAVTVAVVDPGVGSTRKAIAVRTRRGHVLVGPDNGIFTLLLQTEGLDRAVELRNDRYFRRGDKSHTFHGRDIFSPVAAHLASGTPLDSLGPAITPMRLRVQRAQRVDHSIIGTVRYVEDPFGNVVTNIPAALLDSIGAHIGDTLELRLRDQTLRLPWGHTFSDVPLGKPVAVPHERGLFSLSLNQGDFAATYHVSRADSVRVTIALKPPAPSPKP